MKIHYQQRLKPLARNLRNNMTDAERKLWHRIRREQIYDVQFFRQRPIGRYIVDFYCPTRKLVIEIDGSQHLTPHGMQKDKEREAFFTQCGIHILRFDDREVLTHIEGVLETIADFLKKE